MAVYTQTHIHGRASAGYVRIEDKAQIEGYGILASKYEGRVESSYRRCAEKATESCRFVPHALVAVYEEATAELRETLKVHTIYTLTPHDDVVPDYVWRYMSQTQHCDCSRSARRVHCCKQANS
jgi:hypothetical protein